jgi:hypothetical protein
MSALILFVSAFAIEHSRGPPAQLRAHLSTSASGITRLHLMQ